MRLIAFRFCGVACMMSVSLVAIKNMTYAGRQYFPGESVDVQNVSEATVLKLAKLAIDAPEGVAEAEEDRTYRTADLSAQAVTPRRRTRRADLVAEE